MPDRLERYTFRMLPTELEALKSKAAKRGVPVTTLLRQLIRKEVGLPSILENDHDQRD